jgi:hypothetical protein
MLGLASAVFLTFEYLQSDDHISNVSNLKLLQLGEFRA